MSQPFPLRNIDYLAAKHGQAAIEKLVLYDSKGNKRSDKRELAKAASAADNTVTKALGVLQEDGIYACFLYLLARETGEKRGQILVAEMLALLEDISNGALSAPKGSDGKVSTDWRNVLTHIREKVVTNLETTLLAREALEQMLIYARYGAKACS